MAASEKQRASLQRTRDAKAAKAAAVTLAKESAPLTTLPGESGTVPSSFHLNNPLATFKRAPDLSLKDYVSTSMSDQEVWIRVFCAAVISREVKSHTQLEQITAIAAAGLAEFKKTFK